MRFDTTAGNNTFEGVQISGYANDPLLLRGIQNWLETLHDSHLGMVWVTVRIEVKR